MLRVSWNHHTFLYVFFLTISWQILPFSGWSKHPRTGRHEFSCLWSLSVWDRNTCTQNNCEVCNVWSRVTNTVFIIRYMHLGLIYVYFRSFFDYGLCVLTMNVFVSGWHRSDARMSRRRTHKKEGRALRAVRCNSGNTINSIGIINGTFVSSGRSHLSSDGSLLGPVGGGSHQHTSGVQRLLFRQI